MLLLLPVCNSLYKFSAFTLNALQIAVEKLQSFWLHSVLYTKNTVCVKSCVLYWTHINSKTCIQMVTQNERITVFYDLMKMIYGSVSSPITYQWWLGLICLCQNGYSFYCKSVQCWASNCQINLSKQNKSQLWKENKAV